MSAPIVFIDTETTGLHPGRRPWEIAIIRRPALALSSPIAGHPVADDVEHLLQVNDVDISDGDLFGLRVGGFHDRHVKFGPSRYAKGTSSLTEANAARRVEELTRGAVLVGSNPGFDAETLAPMLRRHGLLPAWHYRTLDIVTLAAGQALAGALGEDAATEARSHLPWRTEQLSVACGVPVPVEAERHTAMGDARWVRRWWDALTDPSAQLTERQHP